MIGLKHDPTPPDGPGVLRDAGAVWWGGVELGADHSGLRLKFNQLGQS